MKKYVVLEYLLLPDRGFRFWTSNHIDCEYLSNGIKAFKKIIETDDSEEAIETSQKTNSEQFPTYRELEEYYEDNRDY